MLTAEPFLGDSPFVMYLGDNLLQGGHLRPRRGFREHAPDALILLTPVPDPEHYGVAELDAAARGRGRVVRLVEKPAEPAPTSRSSASTCSRAPSTTPRARSSPRRAASSRSPTRSSTWSTRACAVEPHIVRGWWKDTGRLDDMLEANRLILDNLHRARRGRAGRLAGRRTRRDREGRAAGAHDRARSRDRRGAGARLSDCYVGPYTAIGEDCAITGAEVEHSILLTGCSVCDLDGRMESSLLGRNVTVRRGERQPRAYRFMVGDNSDISIL